MDGGYAPDLKDVSTNSLKSYLEAFIMAGYGTDAGFTAWASENGYTLPAEAPSVEVLRNRGAGYIDGVYGARFSGIPTGGFEQERAWPRTGAYAYGQPISG
jgi:hypothetical protein